MGVAQKERGMETAKTAKGGRQVGVVFADLVVDPALQPRLSGLDSEHVAALAETPEAWPPLVAIRRDGGLVVIDGFHRMKAAEVLGLKKIEVEVRELAAGEAARSVAFSLNLFHGRPLLIPDRRAEASRLLKLPEQGSMAIVGWPVLLLAWLVITVFDPTAKRSANRPDVVGRISESVAAPRTDLEIRPTSK